MFTNYLTGQNGLNIMSFNIRYDNPNDAPNDWPNRKDMVAQMVTFHEVDIVGMQEVLKHQIEDLESRLEDYKWIGVGRDDGKSEGEFCPIFYNAEKLSIQKQSTFWLSETCEVPGKMGWDAACNRVVTWAKFKVNTTGKTFFLFNTHFDHRGQIARRESAKLLLAKIDEIAGEQPAFITGDFNGSPESEPYQILTNPKQGIKDAFNLSRTPHYGQLSTFSGFKPVEKDNGNRIDYIFISGDITVNKHAIFTDAWGGKYPSDHFPVFVNAEI